MTYGSSTVKRQRRTNDELAKLDAAIVGAAEVENPVSLRGVFYRVVSMGEVEKTEAGYRAVGRRLLELRRNGHVPYDWITDGTRWVVKPTTWVDLDQMLDDAAVSYRRALWHDQGVSVHVYTEKDAITGVIEPVTEEWDVALGVLRGYASESFCWSVAMSITRPTYVYQLGDHDPSGLDAWRDFQQKVTGFHPAGDVHFERLAVTPEQIEQYNLPTRPTKHKDTRSQGFTGGSVEVDAIPPSVLRGLVQQAIEQHIDPEQLELTRSVEQSERDLLARMRGAP